jgi:predicted transcriptional regulator
LLIEVFDFGCFVGVELSERAISMQINIPDDLRARIARHTDEGMTEVDVIRKALDSLDWSESERAAIQVGIHAMNEGRMTSFDDFDRGFRAQHDIPPEA